MQKKTVAVLLSGLVFPGAGQIYNKQPYKGVIFIFLSLGLIIALAALVIDWLYQVVRNYDGYEILTNVLIREFADFRVPIIWCVLGIFIVWIMSIFDAYIVGNKEVNTSKRVSTK
jgi:TM2 domain-containing membrane protein YozV